MLRFTEIGLFLVPFAFYVTWLIAGAKTPRWAVWTALALTLGMAVGTIWLGMIHASPPNAAYEPAQMVDGHIVPGHAVPKPP